MTEKYKTFEETRVEHAAALQEEINSMEADLELTKQIVFKLTHKIAMLRQVHEVIVGYQLDATSEEPVKRERRRRKNRPARPRGSLRGRVGEFLKDWMTVRELATAIDTDYVQAHRYAKDLCGTGKAERRKRIKDGEQITFEYRLCQEGGLFEQACVNQDPEGVPAV